MPLPESTIAVTTTNYRSYGVGLFPKRITPNAASLHQLMGVRKRKIKQSKDTPGGSGQEGKQPDVIGRTSRISLVAREDSEDDASVEIRKDEKVAHSYLQSLVP